MCLCIRNILVRLLVALNTWLQIHPSLNSLCLLNRHLDINHKLYTGSHSSLFSLVFSFKLPLNVSELTIKEDSCPPDKQKTGYESDHDVVKQRCTRLCTLSVQITHMWGRSYESHPHGDTSGLFLQFRGSLLRGKKQFSLSLISQIKKENKKLLKLSPWKLQNVVKRPNWWWDWN